MSGRFDYVRYDEKSSETQQLFHEAFDGIAGMVENHLATGRAQSLALTKLEEAYMWIGKAIRDEQIKRTGDSPDVPERG